MGERREAYPLLSLHFLCRVLALGLALGGIPGPPLAGQEGTAGAGEIREGAPPPAAKPGETPAPVWLGPDGQPLPFTSEEEVLEFLRTAKVVSMEEVGEGITRPKKVVLEKDGIRMHAIFRDVNEDKAVVRLASGKTEKGFRDSYLFECAAYELSRLLGLDHVPPVVERSVRNRSGSLQVWIEKAVTEQKRREKNMNPPDRGRWSRQVYAQRFFDQLIFNTDRNLGNTLIDSNWKMWFVDHTRAFRSSPDLRDPATLQVCERNLWERLRALDEGVVKQQLSEFLRPAEIKALLERREKIRQHFQQLIEQQGEENVLYTEE